MSTWVTRDLEAVLDELAAPEREVVVTIHLASGQRVVGNVHELVRDRRGATLGVRSLPQRGSVELDVTVIPVSRVEAITVHGALRPEPRATKPAEATSPLELKRRARAFADQLSAQVGAPIAIEVDGELAALAPLFEQVRIALEHVCADELGRAALAQRVRTVRLAAGASSSVAIDAQTLIVTTTLADPLAGSRLQSAIDTLL